MNYSKFLRALRGFLKSVKNEVDEELLELERRRKRRPKISILIPFQSDNNDRKRTFRWLEEYWKFELPDAEIIVGHCPPGQVFSKTKALNNAAKRARGKVLAILDADAYMLGSVIDQCADDILEALEEGNHLWYVPYHDLYRLTKEYSALILQSDPWNPLRVPDPPPSEILDQDEHRAKYGHRYGAMALVFPREALDVLGGFDERFVGWGGEDVALLRALDTLWGKHKITNNGIFHIWHPTYGAFENRTWSGQPFANPNTELANAYNRATGKPALMRELVDEGNKVRSGQED